MSSLTYIDALKLALTKRWKVGYCSQGKICWCRSIELDQPIDFVEFDPHNGEPVENVLTHVAHGGELNKEVVSYLVRLHNNSLTFNESVKHG